jgi:hypothetical protein
VEKAAADKIAQEKADKIFAATIAAAEETVEAANKDLVDSSKKRANLDKRPQLGQHLERLEEVDEANEDLGDSNPKKPLASFPESGLTNLLPHNGGGTGDGHRINRDMFGLHNFSDRTGETPPKPLVYPEGSQRLYEINLERICRKVFKNKMRPSVFVTFLSRSSCGLSFPSLKAQLR